ncbi:hypothetical protein [Phenylobacterium sp.]|uniref:hypothetical protein n=1 Tax=Phenylobacterium sp. TaxID=1871053 RepID=UPI0035ADEE2A
MPTPRKTARALRAGPVALLALVACACSPGAPEGVSKKVLDEAISQGIGDPNTCVLIGKVGSGEIVYRYNTHLTCGRELPSCQGGSAVTVDDVLKSVAKGEPERALSCPTATDGSRSVGWSAGRVLGKELVYAAVMEGQKALPGRVMADRLERAFVKAGLQPER